MVIIPHVLIVDADHGAACATSALVTHTLPHAHVLITHTADAGLRCIARRLPDLLIIDPSPHVLADMRLIQELKAQRPDARVLIVASTPRPAVRRQLEALDIDGYGEKPALPMLLIAQLRLVLHQLNIDDAPQPAALPVVQPVADSLL
jgi:DNA-binding NarL/FixJ family response regulator